MNFRSIVVFLLFIAMPFVGATVTDSDSKPKVEVSLSHDTIMIGDQPILTIKVTKDISHRVAFPEFEQNMTQYIEMLAALGVDTLKEEGSRTMTLSRNHIITSFVAGRHRLDSLPLFLVGRDGKIDTLYSHPLEFTVQTYDIDTTKQYIFDIKAPIDTPLLLKEILHYIILAILVIMLIAVAVYVIIKLRRKEPIFAKPKLPPHIVAVSELNKIKDMRLWQQGKHKEYYTMITDTVRIYLEDRFTKRAMEMTTEEIMDSIKEDSISQTDKDMLHELLTLADLVKFAKYNPTEEANENSFIRAFDFVEHTKAAEESIDENKQEEVQEDSSAVETKNQGNEPDNSGKEDNK